MYMTSVTLHHYISMAKGTCNTRTYCILTIITVRKGVRVCIIMNLEHFICFVKVISSAINAALMQHPNVNVYFVQRSAFIRNAIVNMRQYFHKYTIWHQLDTIPILNFDPHIYQQLMTCRQFCQTYSIYMKYIHTVIIYYNVRTMCAFFGTL